MTSFGGYLPAARGVIAGGCAFRRRLREERPVFLIPPERVSPALFAVARTRADASCAGRAFAADGGIRFPAGLFRRSRAEKVRRDRAGRSIRLIGAAIPFDPRAT
jgi:small multidrug resistance family-3 protein